MQTLSKVEHRLNQLGLHSRFWSRPEVRELHKILAEGESITNACTGRYEGGLALLVSTDKRLLLIDKKVFFLSLENVRYDMVSEVDYTARLLDATIYIHTANKVLRFTSIFHGQQLKALSTYVQSKVMEIRSHEQQAYDQIMSHQQMGQQFQAPVMVAQPAVVQAQVAATRPAQQAAVQPLTRRVPMRPFKRIGSYPTASLAMPSMPERFTPNPYHR